MGQFLVYINGLAILIDGEEASSSSTVTETSFASEASLASKGDRLPPKKANSTRPIVRVLSVSLTCPLVIGLGHSEFFT